MNNTHDVDPPDQRTRSAESTGPALAEGSGAARGPGLLRRPILCAILVFGAAVLTYANTLWGEFVFDDLQNIVGNRWLRDFRSLPEVFGAHAAGFDPKFSTSYYRPLMHVAYMIVYTVAGLHPSAFHALNILLHAITSVIAFLLVRELARRDSARPDPSVPVLASGPSLFLPFVVGLLFAVHAIHTEAVAWLAGITDVSFTLLALWSLLAYVRADGAPSKSTRLRFVWPAVLFFLATLCKETAVMVLPAIFLYEVTSRRGTKPRDWRAAILRLLPLGVAAFASLGLRLRALGGFAPSTRDFPHGPVAATLTALDLLMQYLGKLLLPAGLNALHVVTPVTSITDPRAIVAIAAVVGGTVIIGGLGIGASRRRAGKRAPALPGTRRLVLLGFALTVLPLLPVLYVPALGEGAFAERYLYLPVFGFALLLALAARWAMARWPGGVSRGIAIGLTLLMIGHAVAAVSRNRVWRTSLDLWTDAAHKSPGSAVAQEYLCFAQYSAGQFQEALASCRRALEIDPGRIDARTNLATTLSVLGDLDGALREFQEVLRLRPESAEAHTNLGLTYMAKGRPDLAIASYREALRHDPSCAEALNDLGVALAGTGHADEAIASLSKAVHLAPDNRDYAANLAAAKATGK